MARVMATKVPLAAATTVNLALVYAVSAHEYGWPYYLKAGL